MKNIIFFVLSILVLGACLLSQDTEYASIGGTIFMVLLTIFTLKDVYTYERKKKELSGTHFIVKRDGVISKLLGCFLMVVYFNDNFLDDRVNFVNDVRVVFLSFLIIYVLSTLYIAGFQRAIISGDGFLAANGKFIELDDVKIIGIENGFMRNCKKLIITCEKDQFIFRIKNCDCESVKNLISTYKRIDFEES